MLGGGRYIRQSVGFGCGYAASHSLHGGVEWYGAERMFFSHENSYSSMWSAVIQWGKI